MKVQAARSGLGVPGAVLGSVAILSLAAITIAYLLGYAPSSTRVVTSTQITTITTTATTTVTIVQTSGGVSNSANIAVTSVSFSHSGTSNAGSIVLSNTGTGSAYATGVSISYQGTTCNLPTASVGGTSSPIAGGSSQTLTVSVASAGEFCDATVAVAGNAFNGFVILSNGQQASFTGTFK